MDNIQNALKNSLYTGFIDKRIASEVIYQPELLINQKSPARKILSTLHQEFSLCDEFFISVAFVTTNGIATIINQLKDLEERGVKGYVLVSQYLNFTQPESLKRLLNFKNIELRILTSGNAHAKGYIFRRDNHYNLIIGSSNLTAGALTTNKEWNIKVSALGESGLVDEVLRAFKADFSIATKVTNHYIEEYSKVYSEQLKVSQEIKEKSSDVFELFKPNKMQEEALLNLSVLRKKNNNKALIISATGTGKTFLSAFDAKVFNPRKLLFVVHRLNIAKAALKTFKKVFGDSKSMGIYSGDLRELDCDFIFATVQTISKPNHLEQFTPNYFDYIIIDESHRAAAGSYLRIFEFFKPSFLLGMTATPERTDGDNIFEYFDHNVAYEIRLNRAMEADMLSTFHYYGVTDLIINNKIIDNKSDFNLLVSNERVNRIIEQSEFYGTDSGVLRGLIFCSRKDEALELARILNLKGKKSIALTGDNSEEDRNCAIRLLESDDLTVKLDFIITVDIFNEGIDIPKINQIIMLRPTESAIIFIQQLGRGLRKTLGKEYLTVIDFIGNYTNNYMIPIALYGDNSYNKDRLRKLITEESLNIPGASTVNFDKITKDRIFKSIDTANMQKLADLRNDYNLLKYRLGRVPMMMDFLENNSRDPYTFIEYSKSYFNFVKKVDKTFKENLNSFGLKLLELFSKEINNYKRVEESLILKKLIEEEVITISSLKDEIMLKYGYDLELDVLKSCILNLNFRFLRENKDGKLVSVNELYDTNLVYIENDRVIMTELFKKYLNIEVFKCFLIDSTNYSIFQFDKSYDPENWNNGFILYKKYSRKDVFRILKYPENPVAQNVGGYLVSTDNSSCPIFVNYHKEDHISESTKYEDEFINKNEFDWMSKSNRKLESNDVKSILGKNGDIRLPLFVKKSNDEGADFYYMGEMQPNLNEVKSTYINNDKGGKSPIVKIRFNVFPPVADTMYNYINENINDKDSLDDSLYK